MIFSGCSMYFRDHQITPPRSRILIGLIAHYIVLIISLKTPGASLAWDYRVQALVESSSGPSGVPYVFEVGYCPHPVTVYIRGPIKGYIKSFYTSYQAVTEWGQYPTLRHSRVLVAFTVTPTSSFDMEVAVHQGPLYTPQNTIVSLMAPPPKEGTWFLETPVSCFSFCAKDSV